MAETTNLKTGHDGHGYETTDVSVAGILFFVLGLAVFIVIVTAVLWLYFNRLAREQARLKESRFPLAVADRNRPIDDRLPPAPRLEGLDPDSLMRSGVAGWPSQGKAQRERAREALASYGWADEKAGIAEIPIDRAIDLLAGKLPMRKESANPASPAKDAREGKP